jgi:glycosyltransferase involved in cell wall biosynthesis
MKLSISLIVKNEEEILERCLRSLKGADEIVVCDTGSEDKTIEMAKEYTDKVFTDYKWNDSFAEARNHCLNKCTGDWIVTIDADEFLEDGGIEKAREAIKKAGEHKTINCSVISENKGEVHYQPRIYKNCKEVFWKVRIHNYLRVSEDFSADIKFYYGYSKAHKNDPNRALRILKRVVAENPKTIREKFYLAREYSYRQDWIKALYWCKEYEKVQWWGPEMAENYLLMAKCLWFLQRGDEARDVCLQAIKVNADFKEALRFMAEMSGPKNREYWLFFAEMAENKDVLFSRDKTEVKSEYYDKIFSDPKLNLDRYIDIYKYVGQKARGKVLDVCCGTARLQEYIKDYHGFDFSKEAIKKANNKNVWLGSAYEKKNFGDYDTYVLIEALEHLDDIRVLKNIPSGKNIIFSVPNFDDPAHIRIYTEKIIRVRFTELLDIKDFTKFNFVGNNYILLVEAIKK